MRTWCSHVGRGTLVWYLPLTATCHLSSCTLQHSHIQIVNICKYSFTYLFLITFIITPYPCYSLFSSLVLTRNGSCESIQICLCWGIPFLLFLPKMWIHLKYVYVWRHFTFYITICITMALLHVLTYYIHHHILHLRSWFKLIQQQLCVITTTQNFNKQNSWVNNFHGKLQCNTILQHHRKGIATHVFLRSGCIILEI